LLLLLLLFLNTTGSVLNLTINDFEFIKPITRGGFARVYLAKKKKTGDMYAIKVMSKAEMIKKVPQLLVGSTKRLTGLYLRSCPSLLCHPCLLPS
jgi:serine/threonine protein kinase